MAADTDETKEQQAKIDAFCTWCHKQGCDMSKVKVDRTASGLGLVATQNIEAGMVGMSIPMATLLTVANAAQSEIGQAVLNSATTRGHRVSAQALMYIVMLDAWHNPSSEWHTYVRLMPATHNDPLWWTEEERQELLQGTQLFHEAQRHMTQLREVYDSIFPELSQELPALFPADRYTFGAFLWSRSSLSSRCFSRAQLREWLYPPGLDKGDVPPGLEPTAADLWRLAEDCPAVLCPLLDMTNHNPETEVRVGLVRAQGSIHLAMACTTSVAAGAEYFNNYGSCRTNLQLLLAHGFCVPNNPADTLPMKVLSDDSRRPQLQRRALELAGLQPGEVHELSLSNLLPSRLLALLRILCMPQDGLEQFVNHGAALFEKLQLPIPRGDYSGMCELEVLCTLEGQLLSQQTRIRAADTSATSFAAARHASVYRAGQLAIISKALEAVLQRKRDFCTENGLSHEEEEEEEEEVEVDAEDEEESGDDHFLPPLKQQRTR